MATYEYRCDDCEASFETHELVSEHDDEKRGLPACPECGSVNTHRVFVDFFAKTSSKT